MVFCTSSVACAALLPRFPPLAGEKTPRPVLCNALHSFYDFLYLHNLLGRLKCRLSLRWHSEPRQLATTIRVDLSKPRNSVLQPPLIRTEQIGSWAKKQTCTSSLSLILLFTDATFVGSSPYPFLQLCVLVPTLPQLLSLLTN